MIHYREKEEKKEEEKEEDSLDDPSYRDDYQYIPILGYCYDLHHATAAARGNDGDADDADDL